MTKKKQAKSKTTTPKPPVRKYYFWKYDLYPWLLGGIGTKRPDGRVQIDSYGPGYSFWPVYEFPLKLGLQFHARLKALESERQQQLNYVEDGYKNLLGVLQNHPSTVKYRTRN